ASIPSAAADDSVANLAVDATGVYLLAAGFLQKRAIGTGALVWNTGQLTSATKTRLRIALGETQVFVMCSSLVGIDGQTTIQAREHVHGRSRAESVVPRSRQGLPQPLRRAAGRGRGRDVQIPVTLRRDRLENRAAADRFGRGRDFARLRSHYEGRLLGGDGSG